MGLTNNFIKLLRLLESWAERLGDRQLAKDLRCLRLKSALRGR